MVEGHSLNGEANSKRLTGHDWFEIREQILERDGDSCRNCGGSTNLVVHHIVPIGANGTNRFPNLVTLCRTCHRYAHNERVRDSGKGHSTDAARYLLTVDDLRQVLQLATHPLDRAILTTLAKTGVGVGELCNLGMNDLQLPAISHEGTADGFPEQTPLLRIQHGEELPYNTRRERKGTTYAPIDGELARVLKRWLMVRPDPRNGDPLFISTRARWGLRISRNMIRSALKTHGKAVGLYEADSELNNLTPYALRYFFEQRFAGQPIVRDYLLGRRTDIDWSLQEIATHYRRHVFDLRLGC